MYTNNAHHAHTAIVMRYEIKKQNTYHQYLHIRRKRIRENNVMLEHHNNRRQNIFQKASYFECWFISSTCPNSNKFIILFHAVLTTRISVIFFIITCQPTVFNFSKSKYSMFKSI